MQDYAYDVYLGTNEVVRRTEYAANQRLVFRYDNTQ